MPRAGFGAAEGIRTLGTEELKAMLPTGAKGDVQFVRTPLAQHKAKAWLSSNNWRLNAYILYILFPFKALFRAQFTLLPLSKLSQDFLGKMRGGRKGEMDPHCSFPCGPMPHCLSPSLRHGPPQPWSGAWSPLLNSHLRSNCSCQQPTICKLTHSTGMLKDLSMLSSHLSLP